MMQFKVIHPGRIGLFLFGLFPFVLAGCLYDGEGTAGLPCNRDADCGAQACVERICGGPSDVERGDAESSGAETEGEGDPQLEPPTPQMLPEPCEDGYQECAGPNALSYCDDDGKLLSFGCEAFCGEDDPVDGGCQTNPHDGEDYCWCASHGGPPSATCQQSCAGDYDCGSGESCLSTTQGGLCLPTSCQGCFENGQSCNSSATTCSFSHCS